MTAPVGPVWAADLVVHRGGKHANEVLVLGAAERDHFKTLTRLAAAWTSIQEDDHRAWVAYALSPSALAGVGDYFDLDGRDDPTHRGLLVWLDARLPLETCSVTEVSIVDDDRPDVLVRLQADPPNQGGFLARRSVQDFNAQGFNCEEHTTEDVLYNRVEYATGDVGREQVLDWDDIYTEHQWNLLSDAERLFVRLHRRVAELDAGQLERLAMVIPSVRHELAELRNDAPGLIARADDDQPAEGDGTLFHSPSMSRRRSLGQGRVGFDHDLLDELHAIDTEEPSMGQEPAGDPWLGAGLVPESIPAWQAVMHKVVPTRVWNPDRIVGWDEPMLIAADLSQEDCARAAARWQATGFTPAEAEDWTEALGIEDDWRVGADEAAKWRSRGFTPEDAWGWVRGDVAPGEGAEHAQVFRDAGWHPFYVWTLHCFLERGPARDARIAWASLPITHALNCARAGLSASEAEYLLGCDQGETEEYLSRRFDERGRIDPSRAILFNQHQFLASREGFDDSEWEFFGRRLWDLHDETDEEDRRRGKEPTYGGPRTKKPRWKFLEERAEREKREAERPKPELCPGTGGEGTLEFRDGWEEWYVICRVCGVRFVGGSATPLSPHNRR